MGVDPATVQVILRMESNHRTGEVPMLVGCMLWRIGSDVLALDEQIAWCADRGFEAVAFWTCAGQRGVWEGFDALNASPGDVARLADSLARFAAVDLHSHVELPVADATAQNRALDELARVVGFAGVVGAETITVHIEREADVTPETLPSLREALDTLNQRAGDAGVKLGLELTSNYDLALRPETPNIGLTLDVGHMHFEGGAGFRGFGSPAGLVEAMADRLVHVHAHDYDGTLDHLPIGAGLIDWPTIVGALVAVRYEGVVSLELNADRATADELAASRERLIEWIGEASR